MPAARRVLPAGVCTIWSVPRVIVHERLRIVAGCQDFVPASSESIFDQRSLR